MFANMTHKQQKACKVLIGCAVALFVTIVLTVTLLSLAGKKGGVSDEDYDPSANVLDSSSTAILPMTTDAGQDYLANTVFVGDSNTVRMYNMGLITLDQFVGKEGMGIQSVISDACVYFENDANAYTIPQAIAKMKPQRVIVMLGTNNADGSVSSNEFIADYRQALQAISGAYAYCDIIVAAIPPIPQDHSNYPAMKMQTIDELNQALLDMCEADGYSFLNTSEVLKGPDGFGESNYFDAKDIHFTTSGINSFLNYVRTHALLSQDRRPDTEADKRAAAPGGQESTASTPAPTPQESEKPESFTVEYSVSGEGGTLSGGPDNLKDQTKITCSVTGNGSVTVTAVPKEGYVFERWSDGITTPQRTDSGIRANTQVTASFVKEAIVTILITPDTATVNAGEQVPMTVKVTVNGADYSTADVVWYDNDVKVGVGSSYLFETATPGADHKIRAEITVEGTTRVDTATIFVNSAPDPTPEPTPDPTPEQEQDPDPEDDSDDGEEDSEEDDD